MCDSVIFVLSAIDPLVILSVSLFVLHTAVIFSGIFCFCHYMSGISNVAIHIFAVAEIPQSF